MYNDLAPLTHVEVTIKTAAMYYALRYLLGVFFLNLRKSSVWFKRNPWVKETFVFQDITVKNYTEAEVVAAFKAEVCVLGKIFNTLWPGGGVLGTHSLENNRML